MRSELYLIHRNGCISIGQLIPRPSLQVALFLKLTVCCCEMVTIVLALVEFYYAGSWSIQYSSTPRVILPYQSRGLCASAPREDNNCTCPLLINDLREVVNAKGKWEILRDKGGRMLVACECGGKTFRTCPLTDFFSHTSKSTILPLGIRTTR